RCKAAEQIEDKKGHVAKSVLNVVTKDPQVEHVATQMQPPAVHEHGRKQRRELAGGIGQEAARHKRPLVYERVAAAELDEKEQHIQQDERIGDDWNGSLASVVITEW